MNSRAYFSKQFYVYFTFMALVIGLMFPLQTRATASYRLSPPQSGTWTFYKVRVFSDLNSNASIVKEKYDSSGGQVEINVNGNVYGLCPGGAETLRFDWNFNGSITPVNPGKGVSASLEASAAYGKPCTGGLASRTVFAMYGSNGQVNPFNAEETSAIDGGRFYWESGNRLWANPSAGATRGGFTVKVNDKATLPGKNRAWFSLNIETPAGSVRYVYLYQMGGDTVGSEANACGYTLGSGIYNKWKQLGGEKSVLGCPVTNEGEASRSPQGTTGRWAQFRGGDGGYIIWHGVGRYAGYSFDVNGCFFKLYKSINGTSSWLGFPVGDAYAITGGSRQDFEGGYLQWNSQTGVCQAYGR